MFIGQVLRKYILENQTEKVSSILSLINLERLLEMPEKNEEYLLSCLITTYSKVLILNFFFDYAFHTYIKVGDVKSAQKWFDLHFSVEQNKKIQTKSSVFNISVNHSLMEAYAAKGQFQQVFAMLSDISTRQRVRYSLKFSHFRIIIII